MIHKVKHLPANAGDPDLTLGWERPLEKGMGTHSSILTWRIPWTEEPGCLQSMGLQELGKTEQLICQKVEWRERQVRTAGEEKS